METIQKRKRSVGITYSSRADYKEVLSLFPKKYYLLMLLGLLCTITKVAIAGGSSLTAMFYTPAMQGSWHWIQKLSWLGTIVQVIISICSAIGLMMIVVSTVITLVYYANPSLFDSIHTIHMANTEGPMGMGSILKNITGQGNGGGGPIEGITGILLSFIPDFKEYSEVSDDSLERLGFSDGSPTVLQWLARTAPRKIAVGILLTAAFSGALFQFFGDIINGGVAVINNVTQYQLKDIVNRAFAEGAQPNTTLNLSGTDKGEAQQSMANLIYSQACGANNIISTYGRQQVMNKAEAFVSEHVNDAFVQKLSQGQKINDTTWSSIKYNGSYVASKPVGAPPNTSFYAPMSVLVPGSKVSGGVLIEFNPHVSTTTISPFSINGKNLQ